MLGYFRLYWHGHIRLPSHYFIPLFFACAALLGLAGCRFEKRLYRPGWHVEGRGQTNETTPLVKPIAKEGISKMTIADRMDTIWANEDSPIELEAHKAEYKAAAPQGHSQSLRGSMGTKGRKGFKGNHSDVNSHKQLHPKAALSLLLGVVSMGCVILPLLVSGLGVAIVIGLAVLLLLSAILAQKCSRIAMEDMYMARNRYAGKAMAAAGMILSILSLVALLGILIIALLGVAFLSLI
jgi:hypothetical protein